MKTVMYKNPIVGMEVKHTRTTKLTPIGRISKNASESQKRKFRKKLGQYFRQQQQQAGHTDVADVVSVADVTVEDGDTMEDVTPPPEVATVTPQLPKLAFGSSPADVAKHVRLVIGNDDASRFAPDGYTQGGILKDSQKATRIKSIFATLFGWLDAEWNDFTDRVDHANILHKKTMHIIKKPEPSEAWKLKCPV